MLNDLQYNIVIKNYFLIIIKKMKPYYYAMEYHIFQQETVHLYSIYYLLIIEKSIINK